MFASDEQRLRLSIPQTALRRSPRGYVGQERCDSVVTVGMLNYNTNLYTNRTSGGPPITQRYVGLSAGVNVRKWRCEALQRHRRADQLREIDRQDAD